MNHNARIALIGFGRWGRNVARVLNQLEVLHGICDSDENHLKEAAALYPRAKLFRNLEEMLASLDIHAVAVTTPPATHHEISRAAMLSGKDVFVEKPLALTSLHGRELVDLSVGTGRILMVGHILHYHPAIAKLKEIVRSGKLGQIRYIYSNRLNHGTIRTIENILWSFAPHDISVILSLTGEKPVRVAAHGGNYINSHISDITVSNLEFASGTKAHIFVSWLHPHKEQRLIVIGSEQMAIFNEMKPDNKLLVYPHRVAWSQQMPVAETAGGINVPFDPSEPLVNEMKHFLECIASRSKPLTDGAAGLEVLDVLENCQKSLEDHGEPVSLRETQSEESAIHPTAVVDPGSEVKSGAKIWHFSHVMSGSVIGEGSILGQNVFVGAGVRVGRRCKVQNNVSLYSGVTLEDEVFCGPSCVFTNVINPRATVERKDEFKPILVRQGATLGANATVICGHTIGAYAMVGAGAVVTHDVPDYAIVYGNPARLSGWACACGQIFVDLKPGSIKCPACNQSYQFTGDSLHVHCHE